MSGKKRLSFSEHAKLHDSPTKKTKTKFSYGGLIPQPREQRISPEVARLIADQYEFVLPSPYYRARIGSHLVGNFRTSGALNPKRNLFMSRVEELQHVEDRVKENPHEEEELLKEAAKTMLAGGRSPKKICRKDQIRNPTTGRCVLKKGSVGKTLK
jgi:hypothetical protein